MLCDRKHVQEAFNKYTTGYNVSDPRVRLKIDHTYRVAAIADQISSQLEIASEDKDLGWLLGMLHDYGRFEQLKRYDTFVDNQSVDHAFLGAELLFSNHEIRKFIDDDSGDSLLEKAVFFHNKLSLPSGLSKRETFWCNLIRDADKIDILRVICETPFEDIYHCLIDDLLASEISDTCFNQICDHKTIDRKFVNTPMDIYIDKIAFVYGITFPVSLQIINSQGYLHRLISIHSKNPETEAKLQHIRRDVDEYMTTNSKII